MYTFESRIRYSECDGQGRLTLPGLINYLQDCTTFHSEDIERGVGYMRPRGIAWLLAAWQIEIARLPVFCERIRVRTWCYDMTRTLAKRNFVIEDASGEVLVRADSLWFVFDFAAGRPIRIGEDQHIYLSDEEPLDMPPTSRRLPVEGDFTVASQVVVNELHLDSNHHVNNAQYLGMATNALAQVLGVEVAAHTSGIARICVQYKRQARLGDIIVPRVHIGTQACTVNLTDPDGESFAIVRIEART